MKRFNQDRNGGDDVNKRPRADQQGSGNYPTPNRNDPNNNNNRSNPTNYDIRNNPNNNNNINRGAFANTNAPNFPTAPNPNPMPPNPNTRVSIHKGVSGRSFPVLSNYYAVQLPSGMPKVFQYSVKFDPPVEAPSVRGGLLGELSEALGPFLLTGEMLFLLRSLPKGLESKVVSRPKQRGVKREESKQGVPTPQTPTPAPVSPSLTPVDTKSTKGVTYSIAIMPSHASHLEGLDLFFVLNTLIRKMMRAKKFERIGRSHFDPSTRQDIRGKKYTLLLWQGYMTTLERIAAGLYLNVDLKHKVLRPDRVLDTLQKKRDVGEMRNFMRDQTVYTPYNNKHYRITNVEVNKTMESMTFVDKSGRKISILQYMQERYPQLMNSRNLDFHQPLLESSCVKRNGETQTVYLLPQFCNFTGITDDHRSDRDLMQEFKRATLLNPRDRNRELDSLLKGFADPCLKEAANLGSWDIMVSRRPIQLQARELNQEVVLMKNPQSKMDEPISNRQGDFSNYFRERKIFHFVPFSNLNWEIVYPDNLNSKANDLMYAIKQVADGAGINLNKPMLTSINPRASTRDYEDPLLAQRSPPNDFVMCILQRKETAAYEAVKNCMSSRPVPSQCIVANTIDGKKLTSVCGKIMLQLAAKLGGAPWGLDFRETTPTPTIIIGIDFAKNGSNTTIGMVASLNRNMNEFYSRVYKTEGPIAALLHKFVVDVIREFQIKYQNNRVKDPASIIIYREGLGEGQMKLVMDEEYEQVKTAVAACKIEVEIVMVCVQKRISTRFSTLDERNVPSGTIVDDTVTASKKRLEHLGIDFDFYLVAQCHLQNGKDVPGTLNPAHYWVRHPNLANSKYTVDILQRLTYQLCHMYFNWPGTVSAPALCKYAKVLATMGKALRNDVHKDLYKRLHYM